MRKNNIYLITVFSLLMFNLLAHTRDIQYLAAPEAKMETAAAAKAPIVVVASILSPENLELVWSDECNTPGAPDGSKWTYDIGLGDNGQGNAES